MIFNKFFFFIFIFEKKKNSFYNLTLCSSGFNSSLQLALVVPNKVRVNVLYMSLAPVLINESGQPALLVLLLLLLLPVPVFRSKTLNWINSMQQVIGKTKKKSLDSNQCSLRLHCFFNPIFVKPHHHLFLIGEGRRIRHRSDMGGPAEHQQVRKVEQSLSRTRGWDQNRQGNINNNNHKICILILRFGLGKPCLIF